MGKWEDEGGSGTLRGEFKAWVRLQDLTQRRYLQPEVEVAKVRAWNYGFCLRAVPSSGCKDTLWPAEGRVHPIGPIRPRAPRAIQRLPALYARALAARLLPAAMRRGPDTQRRQPRPRPRPNLGAQGLRFPTLGKDKRTKDV